MPRVNLTLAGDLVEKLRLKYEEDFEVTALSLNDNYKDQLITNAMVRFSWDDICARPPSLLKPRALLEEPLCMMSTQYFEVASLAMEAVLNRYHQFSTEPINVAIAYNGVVLFSVCGATAGGITLVRLEATPRDHSKLELFGFLTGAGCLSALLCGALVGSFLYFRHSSG